MKKHTMLAALFVLGLSTAAHADFFVEGTVMGFDAKSVKLRQENGNEINIKRSSLPNLDGYVMGKAKVRTMVTSTELIALNPNIAKQMSRKPAAATDPKKKK